MSCPFPFVSAPDYSPPCLGSCENLIFYPADWRELKRLMTALGVLGTFFSALLAFQQFFEIKTSRGRVFNVALSALGVSVSFFIPVVNGYQNTWCKNPYTTSHSGSCVFQGWLLIVSTISLSCSFTFMCFNAYCIMLGSHREKYINSQEKWINGFTFLISQLVGIVYLSKDTLNYFPNSLTCFDINLTSPRNLWVYYFPMLIFTSSGFYYLVRAVVHVSNEIRRLLADKSIDMALRRAYLLSILRQFLLAFAILFSLSNALYTRFSVGRSYDHTKMLVEGWASCRLLAAFNFTDGGQDLDSACGALPSSKVVLLTVQGKVVPSIHETRALIVTTAGLGLAIYAACGIITPRGFSLLAARVHGWTVKRGRSHSRPWSTRVERQTRGDSRGVSVLEHMPPAAGEVAQFNAANAPLSETRFSL